MPRKKKTERSEAQRRADEAYAEKARENARKRYTVGGFRSVGAMLKRAEAERIAALFKAHGVTVAEVLKATAQSLTDGSTTPEAIRQAAQAWTERQKASTDGGNG